MMSILKNKLEYLFYFLAIFFLYFFQIKDWNGEYLDTDCYFHALRMINWFEYPSFWEQKMGWSNYPIGEVSHWTRVIYIVWGVLTLPFLLFYKLKDAVFNAGLLISPLFLVLSVMFLVATLKDFLNTKLRFLVLILLFVQANFIRTAYFNRPDHHVMFVFLSILILYFVNLFNKSKDEKYLTTIAFTLSVALWLAVEGVFLFTFFVVYLFVLYWKFGCKYDYLLKVSFYYAVGVSIWWCINPCYEGWLYVDVGRLSIFWVVLCWLGFYALKIAQNEENKIKQIGIIGGVFTLGVVALYCLIGFNSPIDERIYPIFINRITEMNGVNLYTGAYSFIAIILGGILYGRMKNNELFWYLLISLIGYTILSMKGIRFLPYSSLYAVVIIAMFLQQRLFDGKKIRALVIFFVLLEYISFILNLLIWGSVFEKPAPTIYFNGLDNLPQGSVVTDTFFAPHFVWYGNRPVVASPYHGNVEGLLDNHEILFSSDDAKVIELLKKHKVGAIYLSETSDNFYYKPLENCDKLYGKILGCKNYPDWLIPVNNTDGSLFKIDYNKI